MDDEGRRWGRDGGEGILDTLLRAVFGSQPKRPRSQETERVVSLPEAEPLDPEILWRHPDDEDELGYVERLDDAALQPDEAPSSVAVEEPAVEEPADEERGEPPSDPLERRGEPPLPELEHPDVSIRLAALAALVKTPEDAPVAAVTARLRDPEPRVRQAAVQVVDVMGDDRTLLLLLESMHDPAEDVRRAAAHVLRRHRSPALLELLRGQLAVPARARAAATILAEMREVAPLAEAARRPETRGPVRDAVEETGVVAELLGEMRDRDPERRRIACEQIGAMGVGEAVEPLVERLADPDRGVRIKAAEALARIGDRSALHALKRAFVWDPDAAVVLAAGNAIRRLSGGRPASA